MLDAKGPGEIKASNITSVADVEILNPDLVIANLNSFLFRDGLINISDIVLPEKKIIKVVPNTGDKV